MDNHTPQDQQLPTVSDEVPAAEDLDLEAIIQEFRDTEDGQQQEDSAAEDAPQGVTTDTVTMDLSQLPKAVYDGAVTIDDEDDAPVVAAEEKAEPFSEKWEPEYEQPMIFHPQNRFQELKKKLINGPERRYYKLEEKGTGKLQVLLFLSMLVAVICMGTTVLYQLNLVNTDRMKLMIFGQLLCMFLSALLGSYQLIEGLADLVRGRFPSIPC